MYVDIVIMYVGKEIVINVGYVCKEMVILVSLLEVVSSFNLDYYANASKHSRKCIAFSPFK